MSADFERVEAVMKRALAAMEKDFVPFIGTPSHQVPPEMRSALALEYIAFQVGRIRQALEKKD